MCYHEGPEHVHSLRGNLVTLNVLNTETPIRDVLINVTITTVNYLGLTIYCADIQLLHIEMAMLIIKIIKYFISAGK